MRVKLSSIMVNDQEKALQFYTTVLGFVKKHDIPLGGSDRWLTLVSPEDPEGVELVLEPSNNPAAKTFTTALKQQGIPYTALAVDDVRQETQRLKLQGVAFTQEPTEAGPTLIAVFDDTCGNLIQIYQG